MEVRSGPEGRRHEAEAVTAGGADGGKRDAADPATGGIPTEPGDGRPRRMRTRRPAGIRWSRRCAAPPATLWLSADRMCWAGNAAAFSRSRTGRRDAWRWTRPRRQSNDCRAGRGRSQAPSATGGRGCGGIPRILTCKHTPPTPLMHTPPHADRHHTHSTACKITCLMPPVRNSLSHCLSMRQEGCPQKARTNFCVKGKGHIRRGRQAPPL